MKRMAWMAAGAALLLAAIGAAAQSDSLGDVARQVRKEKEKDKAQQNTTSRHFDNDNLPTQVHLSVVGTEAANDASEGGNQASDKSKEGQGEKDASSASSKPAEAKAPDSESKAPASESKSASAENSPENKDGKDDWSKKLADQKAKIDSLTQELDITEREYRLRAVAMYSDAGNRLRNSAEWDKDDAQYKKDMADKQTALDAAKQQLTDMQEQARQAGAPPGDIQ